MKKSKIIIVGLLTTLLMACGGGGGGGSGGGSTAADTESLDLTGVWKLVGIDCYNQSGTTLTARGVPILNSSLGTFIIKGNQFEMTEWTSSASCRVSMKRSIVANLQLGDANLGGGIGSLGATTVSVYPTTTCSLTYSFNMFLGFIEPEIETYTNGESLPQQEFAFFINRPELGIGVSTKVVGRPTDVCFNMYKKTY